MTWITRRGLLVGVSAIALAGLSGNRLRAADNVEILASLPNMAFPFFVHMMKAIHGEADKLGDITILESDGQGSSPKQTADVETALVKGVKGIVISPNEVDAMAPAIQGAVDSGVPVVTIDRRVDKVACRQFTARCKARMSCWVNNSTSPGSPPWCISIT